MASILSLPLTSTLSGVSSLQHKGLNPAGNEYPTGIPGVFDFVDSSIKLTVNEADAITFGDRRTEMVFMYGTEPFGEKWYTWKFMISSAWNFKTGMAIMQIHENADIGADPVAVQFVLMLENNQLLARVPDNTLVPGNGSHRMSVTDFQFDKWYSMCFHVNWQSTSIGFWEMFVDGAPMFRQYNIANAYNFINGGYLKLGIYNFTKSSGWGTKTIQFKDVNIWSGNDGYQTVMGKVPSLPNRSIQS